MLRCTAKRNDTTQNNECDVDDVMDTQKQSSDFIVWRFCWRQHRSCPAQTSDLCQCRHQYSLIISVTVGYRFEDKIVLNSVNSRIYRMSSSNREAPKLLNDNFSITIFAFIANNCWHLNKNAGAKVQSEIQRKSLTNLTQNHRRRCGRFGSIQHCGGGLWVVVWWHGAFQGSQPRRRKINASIVLGVVWLPVAAAGCAHSASCTIPCPCRDAMNTHTQTHTRRHYTNSHHYVD